MKTTTILLLALLAVAACHAQSGSLAMLANTANLENPLDQHATAERSCVVSNEAYLVKYSYNTMHCFIPATMPPGKPHYSAKISVFRGTNQIGRTFDGTYVEGGCFEDKPEDMVQQAYAQKPEPDQTVWGVNVTNSPYTLEGVITNDTWATNILWSGSAISNAVVWVDPLADLKAELNSYVVCMSNSVPPWYEDRDRNRVTDTNLIRILDLWRKTKRYNDWW